MSAHERAIRNRVQAIYNRPEADFPDRAAYDDYLEEREDIIFSLTEGDDAAAAEAKLTAYAAANAASIAAHAAAAAEAVRGADAETGAAASTAAAPDPAAAYAPAAPPAPALAAAPMPTAAPPVPSTAPLTEAALRAVGAASGWDEGSARRAGVVDALTTLFAF